MPSTQRAVSSKKLVYETRRTFQPSPPSASRCSSSSARFRTEGKNKGRGVLKRRSRWLAFAPAPALRYQFRTMLSAVAEPRRDPSRGCVRGPRVESGRLGPRGGPLRLLRPSGGSLVEVADALHGGVLDVLHAGAADDAFDEGACGVGSGGLGEERFDVRPFLGLRFEPFLGAAREPPDDVVDVVLRAPLLLGFGDVVGVGAREACGRT